MSNEACPKITSVEEYAEAKGLLVRSLLAITFAEGEEKDELKTIADDLRRVMNEYESGRREG